MKCNFKYTLKGDETVYCGLCSGTIPAMLCADDECIFNRIYNEVKEKREKKYPTKYKSLSRLSIPPIPSHIPSISTPLVYPPGKSKKLKPKGDLKG